MIVVLPDSKTIYNGSMYSSSVTTGDFEQFIARDVVAYIDAHYRTIPDRTSRGLVGHSMGGYGASRIGMKHPEVFGALYIMSPCCMSSMAGGGPGPADQMKERAIASEKKVAAAKSRRSGGTVSGSPRPSTQSSGMGLIPKPSTVLDCHQGWRSSAGDCNCSRRIHRWPL
jgi:enterochelin esterase-like enzyme